MVSGWCIEWHFWRDDRVVVFRVFPNHDLFTPFFRNHFLCFVLPFFFKMQSKKGVRIIHGRALYKGKYGTLKFWSTYLFLWEHELPGLSCLFTGCTALFDKWWWIFHKARRTLLSNNSNNNIDNNCGIYPWSSTHPKVILGRSYVQSNWNLEMVIFEERGKPENSEKNLSEQGEEPTTNFNPLMPRTRAT